jgi:hypothetical protein
MLQVMERLILTGPLPLQIAIVGFLSQFITKFGTEFFIEPTKEKPWYV